MREPMQALLGAIEHTRAGKDHERLRAMLAPFDAVLERYPAQAKVVEAPATEPGEVVREPK